MKALVIMLSAGLPFAAIAQTPEEINLDQLTENFLSALDDEMTETENLENYTQLLSHPIDLNNASREQISLLKILNDQQIQNLFAHREANGDLISMHELQTIEGFDIGTIRKLQRYAVVKDPSLQVNKALLTRIRNDGENYLMIRYDHAFEAKKGFATSNENQQFTGAPGRLAWRIRSYRPGDFSFGITAEKDPGERITWNPQARQYGMDYYAMHAQLQNKGRIKNLIVGDYQAQFGQGLIWGGSIGFGKGAETITSARRANIGFVPYTSAYESGNLRGVAATVSLNKNIILSSFFSGVNRDASVNSGSDEPTVTSFQTTGFHRNKSELEKRKAIGERLIGGVLEYEKNNFNAGINFQHIVFDSRVEPVSRVYNDYAFSGKSNTNAGIFLNYTLNNVSFFSESAHTLSGGHAVVGGALVSLTRRMDLAVVYRRFERDYQPFYTNAFSENTNTQNETGMYWGLKYKFSRRVQYAGYFDVFRFPGIKFRTYSPSTGYEWLMRLQWQPSKTTSAFIQMRQETKSRNISPAETTLYQLERIRKNNYWMNLDYQPSPGLRLKTRFQFSTFQKSRKNSEGFALLQDISYQFGKLKWTARYALFETDDYDNRQYVYEHDVWLSYALPAYHGKGVRKYLLVQYKLNKTLTFWLRYSQTRYTDRDTIGSGVEEINGNQLNDIKFEMRVRF